MEISLKRIVDNLSLQENCRKTCFEEYGAKDGFACEWVANDANSNGKCSVYLSPISNHPRSAESEPSKSCWIFKRNTMIEGR